MHRHQQDTMPDQSGTHRPHTHHAALSRHDAAEAPTEQMTRAGSGIMLKVGRWRWSIPAATVLSAGLMAAGGAWSVVANERAAIRAADERLAERIEAQADQIRACKAQLATTEVVLAEIRASCARIDARVAEVQVTLMRQGAR